MIGQGHIGDAGFGSPFSEEDGGFGSPFAGDSDSGFGSPFSFENAATEVVPFNSYAVLSAPRWQGAQYSEEGGYTIEVRATAPVFVPASGYRVDLVDQVGGVHPPLEPGCYSAVQDSGTNCQAIAGGYSLLFALPPIAPGTYTLRITHPNLFTLEIFAALEVYRHSWAAEIDSIRGALPPEVYYAVGSPPALPNDNPPEVET